MTAEIDPIYQQITVNHFIVLFQEYLCQKSNEDDAKLSYEVAHRLILKLAEYVTEKAANPVKVSRNIMINQNSCSYLLLCFVKVFFVKSIPQKKNFGGIDFMEKIQILLTCISLIPRKWKNGTKF